MTATDVVWRVGDPYPNGWTAADAIVTASRNPRRGDIDGIAESIRENGFFETILVQRWSDTQGGPRIIIGNHRYRAGVTLGMTMFPVRWVDIDDDAADRILLADNRFGDRASWDDPELIAMLDDLVAVDMLIGSGFTESDLAALRASIDIPDDDDFGGRMPSSDVHIAVGTVVFDVPRPEWDAFESHLVATVGSDRADHIDEVRGRLGL